MLVPTTWAHYAHNTSIVVGYETQALRSLGFELRPVVYSELGPSFKPTVRDSIELNFVNRNGKERNLDQAEQRAECYQSLRELN